jgi:hypothetical protein
MAPRTGRSSDRPPPTPTSADGFALTGPSRQPDPALNAYRKDLADVALAGDVFASHYARPVTRTAAHEARLHAAASEDAETVRILEPGEAFALLEDSLGWAWGYAASDHRVGYVRSDALSKA